VGLSHLVFFSSQLSDSYQDFQRIPEIFKNEVVFVNALEKANIDNFNRQQLDDYEGSLKTFRDLKNVVDSAWNDGDRKGFERGVEKGRDECIEIGVEKGIEIGVDKGVKLTTIQIAKAMKDAGIELGIISKVTGLSVAEIELL